MKTATHTPLPLHRMAVFAPGRQNDDEIRASYIARQAVLDLIVDDIRRTRSGSIPQHHLIIGQRGMGKTTLLKRLHVALREEPLASQFIPLGFPEEQYSVDRLSTVFLNCLDSLADTLEREEQDQDLIDRIDAEVERLRRDRAPDEVVAQDAERTLMEIAAKTKRRPVLLVDNLDLIFDRLKKPELHYLRAFLMKNGAPILIGASVHPPEDTQDYDAPFYDHFKPHYLSRLSLDEMREVLVKLAERAGNEEIPARIHQEQGRLHALHALTGGNPRTTRILFEIFAHGFSKEAYEDLEALLDWMTPIYKARFEELADQAQVVVSAIATIWEPAVLSRICEATRLQPNQVSPQLDRLKKSGIIEEVTVDPPERTGPIPDKRTPKDRTGYQLAERFFNIWFLMRQATRRDKRNLIYLTRFIECLYTHDERADLAEDLLKKQALSKAEKAYGLALEQSLQHQQLRLRLHDHLIGEFIDAKNTRFEDIEDLIDPAEIPPQRWAVAELRDRLCKAVPPGASVRPDEFADLVLSAPILVSRRQEIASTPLTVAKVEELVAEAQKNLSSFQSLFGISSGTWLASLFRIGVIADMRNVSDLEAAILRADTKEKMLACVAVGAVARSTSKLSRDSLSNVARWLRPDESCTDVSEWLGWVTTSVGGLEWKDEGIAGLVRVLEIDPNHAQAASQLATLLEETQRPSEEVLSAYRRAATLNRDDAYIWTRLGSLLCEKFQRVRDAEVAFRHALQVRPDYAWAWAKLSDLQRDHLGDNHEAEINIKRAIELEPTNSFYWYRLGDLLAARPRKVSEAEAAYRKSLELDPKDVLCLVSLGNLVSKTSKGFSQGVTLLRQAIDFEPESTFARASLAELLEQRESTKMEAIDQWLEVIKRNPKYTSAWLSLASWLLRVGDRETYQTFLGKALKTAQPPMLLRLVRVWGVLSGRPKVGMDLLDIIRKATPAEQQHELLFDEIMLDVAQANWGHASDSITQLLQRLGERMAFPHSDRDSWFEMSAVILNCGYGEKLMQVLEHTGFDQRLRPWTEALRAHVRGDRKYIRNAPVEVRESAGQMFDEIANRLKSLPGKDTAAVKEGKAKAKRGR